MIVKSNGHKELIGFVDGTQYHVVFDEEGHAEVDQPVGDQLLSVGAVYEVQVEPTGLQAMKLDELKELAKEKGITLGQARTKPEIIKLIEEAESQGVDGDGEAK